MDTNIENNQRPLVSVIMAACNAEKYIDEAILSIKNQTYTNWELIIIDDKSNDRTSLIIGNYSKEDKRIKIVRNIIREGQALARNKGVATSNGKYIAILDSDDIALSSRLAIQVEFMENNMDVSLVGSHVELINSNGNKIRIKAKPCDTLSIHFCLILQSQFIHSSVMIRRDAFEWAGGYDNDYLYAEDYDLWSRLCDRYTLINIDKVLTKFRVHEESVTAVKNSQKVQIKNALMINARNLRKYLPNTTDKDVFILSNLINNRGYNIIEIVRGLILYRQLCNTYINRLGLDTDQAKHIKMIWKNCLINTISGMIKQNRSYNINN